MKHALSLALATAFLATTAPAQEMTGKVFRVDLPQRRFELLGPTEYDPKTDIGRSRFACQWKEGARIRQIVGKSSFDGIKGPIWAVLRGLDAKNMQAAGEGKPFVVRVATLYDDTSTGTESAVRDNEVCGWFTPDEGADSRGGRIEINGHQVPVRLRDRNWQIFHHARLAPDGFARGCWQIRFAANERDGIFVTDEIEVTALPDTRLTDDPKLPRVLVIGDSISMNYHDAAKAALRGLANYHRNDGNAYTSAHGVLNADLWLGDWQSPGLGWDVIQFNHGLHDLKQPYDPATDHWGGYAVSIEDYKANLEKEIAILRKTGAKLIWCSTTPVPNDNKSTYARRKGASAVFNAAAMEVMRRHPEILVTDLHSVVDGSPAFDAWRRQNDVHFYQENETRILGDAVAATIRQALRR